MGPKIAGKVFRLQFAHHDIGVGYRKRPASTVASRAGIGTCTFRTDTKTARFIKEDRTAARCDGVNAHHGRAHAYPCDFGFECAFEFAVVVRHICRCAAHVEADHLIEAGKARCFDCADDSACGAGQNCVLALKQIRGRQSAGGLHEHKTRVAAELRVYLFDIATQDWREIGVDYCRVAASDELGEWRDFVADGDLRETHLADEFRNTLLVFGIFPSM